MEETPRSYFGRIKRCFNWILRTLFLHTAVTAVVLGLVVGLIIKFTATLSKLDKFLIRFPGELVFRLLHVVTTPLLITGVMTGVARLKVGSSGRIAFRASAYSAITTLLSVTLALILALSIKPGVDSLKKEHPQDSNAFYFFDALVDLARTVIPTNLILDCSRMHKTEV